MERARVLRFLRYAVTALSLTACVLLVALWVRSEFHYDVVFVDPAPGVTIYWESQLSLMTLGIHSHGEDFETVRIRSFPADPTRRRRIYEGSLGFSVGGSVPGLWCVYAPYWFYVATTATIAAVLQIRRLRRFSLRTLLIATTLVAVAMGTVIYLAR